MESETLPLIWHCDPLLIVDEAGEVVFKGSTDVVFTPSVDSGRVLGTAECQQTMLFGWAPFLHVTDRFEDLPVSLNGGSRQGLTLYGSDDEEIQYAWYINGAADRFEMRQDTRHENVQTMRLLVVEHRFEAAQFESISVQKNASLRDDRKNLYICIEDPSLSIETWAEQLFPPRGTPGSPGMILNGDDEAGDTVRWYVDGAAEHFIAAPKPSVKPVQAEVKATPKPRSPKPGFPQATPRYFHSYRFGGGFSSYFDVWGEFTPPAAHSLEVSEKPVDNAPPPQWAHDPAIQVFREVIIEDSHGAIQCGAITVRKDPSVRRDRISLVIDLDSEFGSIETWQELPFPIRGQSGNEGLILIGDDEDGKRVRWYVDGAATDYLARNKWRVRTRPPIQSSH